MSDNITLAQRIIGAAQIDSVRLVGSRAETSIQGPQEAGTDPVKFRQNLQATRNSRGFRVIADLGVSIPAKDTTSPPAVAVDARFELDYVLPAEVIASDEELNAFARVNGLFNAWPYFREFVQTSMARMQLPPLVIPLVRVPSRAASATPVEKPLGPGESKQGSLPSTPTDPTDPEAKKESA